MKIEFEVTNRQAAVVAIIAVATFLTGSMQGADWQKDQMQEAGWIGPDDWSCHTVRGGPDSDGMVRLFNDSMSFEQCGLSTDHRVIAHSAFERSATGGTGAE